MNSGDGKTPSVPGMAPLLTGEFSTDDFDQIRVALAKWNQRYDQLDDGRFQGRFAFAFIGNVQLVEFEVNRVIRSTGVCPGDSFLFTPVTPATGESSWRGKRLKPGMVNVLESSCQMDHRTCPGYSQASILVPRELLERVSVAILGLGCDRLLGKGQALGIGDQQTLAMTRLLSESIRRCFQLTREGQGQGQGQGQGARLFPLIEDLIVEWVTRLGEGQVEDPHHATSSQRVSAVRRVEEFVRENPGQRLGILEMCELARVSKRTLHYAFLEVTGCSPHDFIRSVKLNQARRELKERPVAKGQIEQVARSCGFHRSGRFAAEFRRRFHQLPSAFLGRSLVGKKGD